MDYRRISLSASDSMREAMRAMTEAHAGVVVVCDENGHLLGTVTDGDLRRAIVSGAALDDPLGQVANSRPVVIRQGASRDDMIGLMRSTRKQALPVVDADNRVCGVELLSELIAQPMLPNNAVVMAGGFGTRMRPFTDNIPKPMLKVGGRPLIELIIEGLVEHGVSCIHLLLHHMPDQIIEALSRRSYGETHLEYIVEKEPLGTAGGLALARDKLASPFLVLNGDCLARPNWRQMLQAHEQQGNGITIGCAEYKVQVPYGVLATEDDRVTQISEKPVRSWLTVCGAYCISPEVLDLLPDGRCDMPDLVQGVLESNGRVGYFPMDDVTRLEELAPSHRELWLAEGKE